MFRRFPLRGAVAPSAPPVCAPVSGYVTFYKINKFFENKLFFYIDKMSFWLDGMSLWPDGIPSRAGFGPPEVVWRPFVYKDSCKFSLQFEV